MDKQQVIATLNNLLAITKDGERGFRTCAGGVTSPDLKMELEAAARRCIESAVELQMKIRSLGGEPAASGTVAGALHRAWTDIALRIAGLGDRALLDECKRGEDVAKQAYEEALVEDLPADVEAIVRRQYQGVTENHERIRELRNLAAHSKLAS
jgi:uncharacterized protein (TIGR02284 family)